MRTAEKAKRTPVGSSRRSDSHARRTDATAGRILDTGECSSSDRPASADAIAGERQDVAGAITGEVAPRTARGGRRHDGLPRNRAKSALDFEPGPVTPAQAPTGHSADSFRASGAEALVRDDGVRERCAVWLHDHRVEQRRRADPLSPSSHGLGELPVRCRRGRSVRRPLASWARSDRGESAPLARRGAGAGRCA